MQIWFEGGGSLCRHQWGDWLVARVRNEGTNLVHRVGVGFVGIGGGRRSGWEREGIFIDVGAGGAGACHPHRGKGRALHRSRGGGCSSPV
ncbi:hypothetical protein TIFTF001_011954 [Ficus carica]|uniref:Uncharacterized protein n=1 Tax=Ficus carica TaxID=3494 RepID=A0AA88A1I1_FICCA|nr:hypothetical protein TIFTF001_011954 [Ficus carica]